jgi:23S rRNA (pseudouridine1915-N3)-methyltransferase
VKFLVLAEGKLKDQAQRGWVDEYRKRILRHATIDEVEARNARELAKKIPDDGLVVALEVNGESLSSLEFAERLLLWVSRGGGKVCFVIGGADGLPAEVSRAADQRLSLSKMTLPHRLARVVLFEQIYRALSIHRGEPYARES